MRTQIDPPLTQDMTHVARGTGTHLYVMQAASGLIKIGRSSDPKARARSLEQAAGQQIKVLFVLHGQGAIERTLHAALAGHRALGEWFRDTSGCRLAICEAVGCADIKWLYGEAGNLAKANAVRREHIRQRNKAITDEIVASAVRRIEEAGARKRAKRLNVGQPSSLAPPDAKAEIIG